MAELAVNRSLARAKSLAKRGDFVGAKALYTDVLARFPGNARAASGLAALTDPAISTGRKETLKTGLHAASSALAGGDPQRAIALARDLVGKHPAAAQAHFVLGEAHLAAGAFAPAAQAFAGAIKAQPTFALAFAKLAVALQKLGQVDEARGAYEAAIGEDPRLIEAHLGLARHFVRRHQTQAALEALDRAVTQNPAASLLFEERAIVLMGVARLSEAEVALRRALDLAPNDGHLSCLLARVLRDAGRGDEAVDVVERALAANSASPTTHNNAGVFFRESGEFTKAQAAFDRAISLAPDYAKAHHNRAGVTRYSTRDNHIAAMEALLSTAPADGSRMHLHFALGKALADVGDVDAAFPHFHRANRLRKAMYPYQPARTDRLFQEIKAAFANPEPTPDLSDIEIARRPIFIVGLPRSGTTLLEQILASHSAVFAAGEVEHFHHAVEAAVATHGRFHPSAPFLRDLRSRYGAILAGLPTDRPVVTDKLLSNFQWTGYILSAFPEAHVIDMRRDPIAVGWSMYRHFFNTDGNPFAWDLDDIAHYTAAYRDLMAFYRSHFGDRIVDLDYQHLVDNLEGEARRVLAACDLTFEPACLAFHETQRIVATASDQQVRQSLYKGSSHAWKAYRHHLSPFIESLNATGVLPPHQSE